MKRIIKKMEEKYIRSSLELVEEVFAEYKDEREGRLVCAQHISKELIDYGFEKARYMDYRAVIVEGNPDNYRSRGFVTSADYGIVPGNSVHLPDIRCLMVKELTPGALKDIHGRVEYDFYRTLLEE